MANTGLRDTRPTWQLDDRVDECPICHQTFTFTRRKHHCRYCGCVVCDACSSGKAQLPASLDYSGPQRVCDKCATILAEHQNKLEEEMLNCHFFLRNVPLYQLQQPLLEIGSRGPPDKSFFLMRDQSRAEVIFEMININAAVVPMNTSTAQRVTTQVLKAMDHPFILPTKEVHFLEGKPKTIIVRDFCSKGSLRDQIYHENPKTPWGAKYRKAGSALSKAKIAKIGRQLLEALNYFKSKQYPMPHVHTGNIMMRDSGDIAVTDYENAILGLTPWYRQYGIEGLDPEVVCFGLVLYECGMGQPLDPRQSIESAGGSAQCPVPIYEVLKKIFMPGKGPAVTIESLLQLSIFQGESIKIDVKFLSQPPFESKMNALLKRARTNAPSLIVIDCAKEAADAEAAVVAQEKEKEEVEEVRKKERKAKRELRKSRSMTLPSVGSQQGFAFDAPARPAAAVAPTPAAKPTAAPAAAAPAVKAGPPAPAAAPAATSTPAAAAPAAKKGGPAPPRGGPPPPGPPPPLEKIAAAADLPPPQAGRSDLLAALRNPGNMKLLKKVK
eukprot:TRINITY_DN14984_c0_g1_i1.p1 TRINITY_DN14984_c0_g1~~TRINITY_DN14984_c0_g1_i1.p1  ORF type:complete len:553 (-),score=90.31 TRINITY_DN14984_c0_g1_i1:48-1706(-)